MASFGLSEGAPWGSEGSRSRRKRPYLSPSPPHDDEEEEEEEGWGGPWGSLDRDEREGPREEEEEEGRRGRSRPGCWDAPPRGGSRSPPSRKRERRSLGRSGGSLGAPNSSSSSSSRAPAGRHPDPRRARPGKPFFSPASRSPSSGGGSSCSGGSPARERGRGIGRARGSPRAESPQGSPWEPAPKRTNRRSSPGREGEDALGRRRRMMEGSPSQRSSSRSSSYRSKRGSGWEARQDQDHRERESYPRREGRSGERRGRSGQREGSYGEEEGVWTKPSSSRSEGVPGWEAKQDQDHREREAYPRREGRSGERQSGSYQREGSYGEWDGGQSSSRSKGRSGWEVSQDQDHREREAYPRREGRSGERRGRSGQREGSYGEEEGVWKRPNSSRSKGVPGWEAKQDQDHQEREAYPRKRARSGERQRDPEPTERGFSSHARGEEDWSNSSRRREQRGPSWGDPKWKEGQEDSPSYRDQRHFDSDLRGIDWDSPELKRREYKRPTTSGKGREIRHRSSKDLEDWGSSTSCLEERSLREEQAARRSFRGGSAGPEGRPKIYTGPDKRAVAPRMWVPRGEVVDFWNQCQSLMHMDVKNYLLSTCPRPTLPGKSGEAPVLNPSIKVLLTVKQMKEYTSSSHYLRLIHEEVLDMLGPVMTVCEMAEESIEKREEVDPLELREWARRLVRYMGSIHQRLKLQHGSQVLGMINPRLKRMTRKMCGQNADGLLFAEDKVKLLQDIMRSFPELENQTRSMKDRHDRDRKRGSKRFASRAHEDADELREGISAPESYAAEAEKEKEASLELWHRRFAHPDAKALLELQKRNLGISWTEDGSGTNLEGCAVCARVKGARPLALPKIERRSAKVLDLIHGLLRGPLRVPSLGDNVFVLLFVDDFSRYSFISLLTDEAEVHSRLALYVNMVEKKFQRKPTAFEMGHGAKPFPRDSEAYLEDQGILHGTAAPEQDGTAAREMSNLLEMAAAMLADAELPGRFWPDAIMTSAFLLNRLPVDGDGEIPYELWNGRAPAADDLRVFGSLAYAYIPKTERHRLDPKREETLFLGYAARFKCYKVMNLSTGEFCTRTVDYFDEERKAEKSGTVLETSEEDDFEPMSLLADRF